MSEGLRRARLRDALTRRGWESPLRVVADPATGGALAAKPTALALDPALPHA
jgi:hypothetical protein